MTRPLFNGRQPRPETLAALDALRVALEALRFGSREAPTRSPRCVDHLPPAQVSALMQAVADSLPDASTFTVNSRDPDQMERLAGLVLILPTEVVDPMDRKSTAMAPPWRIRWCPDRLLRRTEVKAALSDDQRAAIRQLLMRRAEL